MENYDKIQKDLLLTNQLSMTREYEVFAIKQWARGRGYTGTKDFYYHSGDGNYWSFYFYDPEMPEEGYQYEDMTIGSYFCRHLPLTANEEEVFADKLFTLMDTTFNVPYKAKDLLTFARAREAQWLEAYYKTFQKIVA